MYQILFIVLTSVLLSCGNKGNRSTKENQSPIDAIIEKEQVYKSLIMEIQDEYGWIDPSCDSLLLSGLSSAAGVQIDIYAARDETTGQWFRTPYRDCYANEQADIESHRRSGSEVSRDMYAGLLWSIYSKSNLGSFERIIDYGRKNNWIMGQGSIDRTFLTHNFQDTLFRLAGKEYKGPPYVWIDPRKDHQRHVVALNIALRGEHEGEITPDMFDLIKTFRRHDSRSALFNYLYHRYSDGNQDKVIKLLADDKLFPPDRLPTARDRCSGWLWMRSSHTKAWKPCALDKTHSGGDFLFMAYLLRLASVIK